MLRATWRRPGSPALLAIGLVIALPALAEAQLFPNMTIRRERPNCATEPPFNAQVRREYFGYYPTCWSKFPEGWACPCPNPELPNAAASFNKIPFNDRKMPLGDEGLLGPDEENPDGMPGNAPGDTPNSMPLPNPSRSPFDLDTDPKPPAGNRPAADPFTTPDPAAPAPARPNPRGNAPASPSETPKPSTSLREMPELPATSPTSSRGPTLQPGSMVMMPDATLASNDSDLGPLPTAPLPGSSYPMNSTGPNETLPVLSQPIPAQAPRRRGFLGGLFGSGNTRKR